MTSIHQALYSAVHFASRLTCAQRAGLLLKGKSGVTKIDKWDTEGYSTQFAGEIKQLDVSKYINKKSARRLDDVIKYTIVAGKKVATLRHVT